MTTTTVPDVDLEQWLAGELERACELPVGNVDKDEPCPHLADWLMVFRPGCGCGRPVEPLLCCDAHHELYTRVGAVCFDCEKPADITFTERIR